MVYIDDASAQADRRRLLLERIDRSAAGCMFIAYDALRGAAERFAREGDEAMARRAERLALEVWAEDPKMRERVLAALPAADEVRERAETIAERAGLGMDIVWPVLGVLRRERLAGQVDGWWCAR